MDQKHIKMNHASLFSGIGGFDLAAEWMGWNNIFHCEWMPFPQKILKHYWPKAISYHDITKTDFTIHRGTIEILTGGFPCQPYSSAGKRLGKDDERHLWPEMLRAIKEIQPNWVVGENVYGLVNWNGGMVFEEVCSDLENCGYQVQPVLLPACSVGAPHRRDRIFFVANSNNARTNQPMRDNREWKENDKGQKGQSFSKSWKINDGNASNSTSNGNRGKLRGLENQDDKIRQSKEHWKKYLQPWNYGEIRDASDPDGNRFQRGVSTDKHRQQRGQEINAQEHISAYRRKISFEEFPTVSPVCGGDDGLPDRLDGITFSKWRQESIKGYGNAVVVPLVYQIFKTIELYEQRHLRPATA